MTLSAPQRTRQYRQGYGQGTGTGLVRRRDPLRQVEEMYDLMNQLLQDFVDPGALGLPAPIPLPADLEETDDSYLIEVEVPGVASEDIDLSLRDNELRISGEIKERERKGILRRKTRRVGQFELVVALPGPVDPDNVEARLHDGVLSIRLRKAQTTRERHIEVHNSHASGEEATAQTTSEQRSEAS